MRILNTQYVMATMGNDTSENCFYPKLVLMSYYKLLRLPQIPLTFLTVIINDDTEKRLIVRKWETFL